MIRTLRRAALLLLIVAALAGEPPTGGALPRAYNGLAATPPMGWNDYNAYGLQVTEALVRGTADAMVANGMRDAGYRYVNVDDAWMAASRDAAGNLRADPVRFPHGIAALAAYVHARGLRLGLYSDAGLRTCGGLPGSLGHERTDAVMFAAWGVDYLKYDNCYAGPGCDQVSCADGHAAPAQTRYAAMRDALLSTGRPITFSICSWGTDDVWRWAAGYGNLWRTSGDIQPTYASMLSIFHATAGLQEYGGAGGWNDPDMLETGNGMTGAEDRTEITLWAMMAAPLIVGADLVHATPATLARLTNRAVIAVDQDPLGRPARVVEAAGGLDVLTRPLAGGGTAVALVNETDAPAAMTAAVGGTSVTDLWTGTTTAVHGAVRAVVPPHGAVLYRAGAW